ncbi:MAG: type II secretion system F family protein [Epsilonproteobacteria bacterium]|nr:type II secretion system F family protein [Campylobacterota bacterium]
MGQYYKITYISKGKKHTVIKELSDSKNIFRFIDGKIISVVEIDAPLEIKIARLKNMVLSFFQKSFDVDEFVSAIKQLATLIQAQIPIKEAIENIAENSADPLISEFFKDALNAIDSGLNLSSTFEKYKSQVGILAIAMVKLGEKTGRLGESLETLAEIYEEIEENKRRFKKAMRYPMMTMTALAVAFTILIYFVVPQFESVFKRFGANLPLPTQILLGLESILKSFGIFILLAIVVLFFLHRYYYDHSYKYRYKVDKILLQMPIFSDIILQSSFYKFLLVLKELTAAGISLVDSLDIAQEILENEVLKEKVEQVKINISKGKAFSTSLKEVGLLDNIALQMIMAGEESGSLDVMLENASGYYKSLFDRVIDGLSAKIEPIMVVVIGGFVLLLALGIFLPMWNLASAVKI